MARYIPDDVLQQLNVSRESLIRLETFVELLLTWQEKINLIGPSTVENIWGRHVLDGLQVLPRMQDRAGTVADLGSGAGIPGLMVALGGGFHVTLYESNGKKAAFLREAIRQTRANAEVHQVRLETLEDHLPAKLPRYVTARALAPLGQLLTLAQPFLSRGATGLFHKGQDVDREITEATKTWKLGAIKHPSMTDSRACILEVEGVASV